MPFISIPRHKDVKSDGRFGRHDRYGPFAKHHSSDLAPCGPPCELRLIRTYVGTARIETDNLTSAMGHRVNLKRAGALAPLMFTLAALPAVLFSCDARTTVKDLSTIADRPAAATPDGWGPLQPSDLPLRRMNRGNVGELVPLRRLGLGSPTTLAFDPVSGDLAVGTAAGLVVLYGAADGDRGLRWLAHDSGVALVSFTSDGANLHTLSKDGISAIWDPSTGDQVMRFDTGNAVSTSAAFSSDAGRLAVATYDYVSNAGTVEVWDTATGARAWARESLRVPVDSLVFADGDALLVGGLEDGGLRYWDAESGAFIDERRDRSRWIDVLATDPNGEVIASTGGNLAVGVVDAARREPVRRIEIPARITDLEFTRDGAVIVAVDIHGAITEWRVSDGIALRSVQISESALKSVAVDPDGLRFAVASSGGSVELWDAKNMERVRSLSGFAAPFTAAAFSPSGALVAGNSQGDLEVWDPESGGRTVLRSAHEREVTQIAFDAAGTHMISAAKDGTVAIWNVDSWRLVRRLSVTPAGQAPAVSVGRGAPLLVLGNQHGAVFVYELQGADTHLLHGFPAMTTAVAGFAFDEPNERLAIISRGGELAVWDSFAWKPIYSGRWRDGGFDSVRFSPDGDALITTSSSDVRHGEIALWSLSSDEERIVLHRFAGQIRNAVGISGTTLIAATDGRAVDPRAVEIWDLDSGSRVAILDAPTGTISSLAVSADAILIAAAGYDGVIWLWGVAN